MCGITGGVSSNIKQNELFASVNSLKHRGPDNQAVFVENNIGLGHSRLSILDLSEASNQPLVSHSGNYVMVYNGEIYNFQELKEKHKIHTKTTSDSEVILELFEKLGVNFVNELNGMFAIAIYDKQTSDLFLFRDRLGIKPLFYYLADNQFAFASEIKALFDFSFVKKEIKKEVVVSFLQLGYIPEPNTFFNNIYKFPAGHYAVFSNGKIKLHEFWKPEKTVTTETVKDLKSAKSKLNSLLVDSVQKRMIADVPLGTFLSGGIDSSLVTAIAQKLSAKPVKTFSIGFKENKFNESQYAKQVAGYLKTEHHEFMVSENDVLELVDTYFNAYDEPYADSSGFPTMLVSKLAKQYVTVALSGDGGDELFHGYGSYLWANRLSEPIFKISGKPLALALSNADNRYKRIAKMLDFKAAADVKTHIFSQEQYFFTQKEITKLLKYENLKFDRYKFETKRILTPSEEQALFDIKYYLKDDLLTKVDRASMQYALEVRVPLLDHRIVEFALNTHHSLKIKNKEQKYLLKQVLYDYVPKKYFNRPKWGFSIPMERWLKTDLKYLLDKYTSKEIVEKYNLLDYEQVENLKKDYFNGQTFLYNRLWLIIVLHKNLEV